MNEHHIPSTRNWSSGQGMPGQGMPGQWTSGQGTPGQWTSGQDSFPGFGQSFGGPPAEINPTVLPAQSTSSIKLPFNINIQNLSDVKALFDRMGGIDGVVATMGKVQKLMTTMQQVVPLIKLFIGKGKGKSSDAKVSRPRRRRTARKRPISRKRTSIKKR
jgi:hypothetical protein